MVDWLSTKYTMNGASQDCSELKLVLIDGFQLLPPHALIEVFSEGSVRRELQANRIFVNNMYRL